ncbi:hypothetical protein JL100_005545 [Skermanella mucosa]|uniref:hypothetical protein n=1 Tax=Skermanella mucosa TaxID=1789672 RepID=UPI00192B6BB9|nr:hypothetical protein [Skermanella mucosa]UEM22216.1 hypothetical protein JL100_005545 [Skermanella mucosa]
MRTLGKLMVIWGLLLPLILLPSAGSGSQRFMPVSDVHFGPLLALLASASGSGAGR